MGRKTLVRSDIHFYHVCSRANHRRWFALPMKEVWGIAMESLLKANTKHSANIHLLLLMQNHYHLLIQTPNSDIDKFMYEFNKHFSCRLREATGLVNRMFGGRYKWSLIDNERYLQTVYRYILRNPIRARIVDDCSSYHYSSFFYQYTKRAFPVPLRTTFDYGVEEIAKWANLPEEIECDQAIQSGLRRTRFSIAAKRSSRRKMV